MEKWSCTEEDVSRLMIFADDYEAEAGVIEALERMQNVEVCVRRLKLGDYEIDGRLLFERKTLSSPQMLDCHSPQSVERTADKTAICRFRRSQTSA